MGRPESTNTTPHFQHLPAHPSGMNKVNPTALLLSANLMLTHLGEHKARTEIEGALRSTLEKGIKTYDLGGSATTSGFAEAIASELKG